MTSAMKGVEDVYGSALSPLKIHCQAVGRVHMMAPDTNSAVA